MNINLRGFSDRAITWIAILFLVIAIWLPFGFSLSGLIEEWGALGIFTEHGPVYFITQHTPFAAHRLRPFTLLPQSIAYTLDSSSFFYWHMLQILAVFLKGAGIASIVMWLSNDRRLALFAGLLMIVYPADTMQLAFRSLHINWAVAITIWAVALTLKATASAERWIRLLLASSGALALVVAIFHYEAALFFMPFPLVLWWAKYGLQDGIRRLLKQGFVVLIWVSGCLAAIGYLAIMATASDLYQASVSGSPLHTFNTLAQNLSLLFRVGLYRLFVHGWFEAVQMFGALVYLPYLLVTLLGVAAAFTFWKPEMRHGVIQPNNPVIWRWVFAGLIGGVLGYLPYLSSLSHIHITQRTYLFATIGASVAISGLFALMMRPKPRLAAIPAALLLVTGLHAQWIQFDHYVGLSLRQKAVLASILEAMPSVPDGEQLLILDSSGITGNTWMLRGELMQSALTYLYGHSVKVETCAGSDDRLEWKSFVVQPNGALGSCRKVATGYEVGAEALHEPLHFAQEDLIVLRLNPDGTVGSDRSETLSSAQLTERWATILGCWPSTVCRADNGSVSTNRFDYDFGIWWSLEDAQWGVGWRDAEWQLGLRPRSFSWKQNEFASISFRLKPSPAPYHFELELLTWVSQVSHDAIKVTLNGHEVPVTWSTPFEMKGVLDQVWLMEGVNELTLVSPIDPGQGVDLAVDRIALYPTTR